MHICLISTEIFAWGKYGGFGRATRLIGRELVKRGVRVSAIVPIRGDQKTLEILDGIEVHGFNIKKTFQMLEIFKAVDADVYHSEEPSFGTFFARILHKDKKHVTTFRDTRLTSDWLIELRYPSLNYFQVLFNWFYEDNALVHWALRHNNGNFVAAHLLVVRSSKKYALPIPPRFLPTPVHLPETV